MDAAIWIGVLSGIFMIMVLYSLVAREGKARLSAAEERIFYDEGKRREEIGLASLRKLSAPDRLQWLLHVVGSMKVYSKLMACDLLKEDADYSTLMREMKRTDPDAMSRFIMGEFDKEIRAYFRGHLHGNN